MLLKILHNLAELCLPNYYNYIITMQRYWRSHGKLKLSITFSRIDVYKHSFPPQYHPQVEQLVNNYIVEVASVDSFY